MENNGTKKSKRVYKLKFDQLWVDAINQIPVCYHSEIYYWLDYYQNHNHSDLIGTIKDDLVRSLFMLIYPTIRRRRLARERQRRYRAAGGFNEFTVVEGWKLRFNNRSIRQV